ncbi:MAG: 2-C-methyl-D-erythritol 2,4-cyclodiphosphate synthase [Sediminibacterium sp.]|nr:2-C-methyl-D-erythritol 2,4-cyclodiphosphate synthase [Sediminibacterium sp.]
MTMRVGNGIDFHALENNRPFYIGGVLITEEFGPIAHSDGDVLLHAICDALLGAAGLNDIGYYFPNDDQKFKNIPSLQLLALTHQYISEKKYKIVNIDSSVCLEKPKIRQFIDEMKLNISAVVNISTECISIKATTTEKLGFIGRGEGVMAIASCLLTLKN